SGVMVLQLAASAATARAAAAVQTDFFDMKTFPPGKVLTLKIWHNRNESTAGTCYNRAALASSSSDRAREADARSAAAAIASALRLRWAGKPSSPAPRS